MTKLNWDRVQAENRIRRNGFTYAYDAIFPSNRHVVPDRVLKAEKKKNLTTSKIQKPKKLPSFLASGPNKIDQAGLHEFLYDQLTQMKTHNNWTKLFQILRELPPKIRVSVISWIEQYSPWLVIIKGKQPIRLIRRKSGEYKLPEAREFPYWAK